MGVTYYAFFRERDIRELKTSELHVAYRLALDAVAKHGKRYHGFQRWLRRDVCPRYGARDLCNSGAILAAVRLTISKRMRDFDALVRKTELKKAMLEHKIAKVDAKFSV